MVADMEVQHAQVTRHYSLRSRGRWPWSSARMVESFALLWISLAYRQKMETDIALNVVRWPGK